MDKEKDKEKRASIESRTREMQGIRLGHYTIFDGVKIPSRKLIWKGEKND